jgi:hypothetical protein
LNELEYAQAEAYKQDPAKEKQDKFKCALDYYSPVIVAMVWMQYDNHHKEWKDREMSVNASQRESSKCTSKFTSINKGRKAGSSHVGNNILKLYEDVLTFVDALKADINYEVFQ